MDTILHEAIINAVDYDYDETNSEVVRGVEDGGNDPDGLCHDWRVLPHKNPFRYLDTDHEYGECNR